MWFGLGSHDWSWDGEKVLSLGPGGHHFGRSFGRGFPDGILAIHGAGRVPSGPVKEAARLERLLLDVVPQDAGQPNRQAHCDSGDPPYVTIGLKEDQQFAEVTAALERQGWVQAGTTQYGRYLESQWLNFDESAEIWITSNAAGISVLAEPL
jgi:hypothetical protein